MREGGREGGKTEGGEGGRGREGGREKKVKRGREDCRSSYACKPVRMHAVS